MLFVVWLSNVMNKRWKGLVDIADPLRLDIQDPFRGHDMSHATLYRIDARGSSVDSFGFDKNDGGFSINNTFDKMTSNTKKKNKNKNKNANKNKNGGKLSCAWTLRLDSDTWDNANYLRRIARIHSKMYYPTLIDRANYILDKWEDILQVNDRNLTRMWMYPPHMIGQRLFLFVSFLFLFLLFFIVFC